MTQISTFTPDGSETMGQRYVILRPLREEPWGGVWLAQDRLLGVEVGLKIITRDDSQYNLVREIFHQEAILGLKLRHPNILGVLYGSDAKEGFFLVQEPFEAENLLSFMGRQPRLSLPQALQVLEQAGQALAYAHEQGVVHQGLDPVHILIAADQIKVANFACPPTDADQAGFLELKAYIAPEVLQGDHLTAASNIFSLGVLGFRILAGSLPYPLTFDEPSPYLVESPPVDLEEIPLALQNLLLRCLAPEPEERLADGRAFLSFLEQSRELWRTPRSQRRPLRQGTAMPQVRESARKAAKLSGKLVEQGKALAGKMGEAGKGLVGKVGEKVQAVRPRLQQVPRRWWLGLGLGLAALMLVLGGLTLMRWPASGPVPSRPASLTLRLPSMGGPPVSQSLETSPPAKTTPTAPAPVPPAAGIAAPGAERPATAAASEERYLLLVVSYATYGQAQAESQKLKGQNFPASVQKITSGGRSLYQVRVGPVAGLKQAEELARRLKSQAGHVPRIVTATSAPGAANTSRRTRP